MAEKFEILKIKPSTKDRLFREKFSENSPRPKTFDTVINDLLDGCNQMPKKKKSIFGKL